MRPAPLPPSRIASLGNIIGRQIVDKCGVFAQQIGRLDMIREKFERIGRANVMLVAARRVSPHFLDLMLESAHLAVFGRPKSFDQSLNR